MHAYPSSNWPPNLSNRWYTASAPRADILKVISQIKSGLKP